MERSEDYPGCRLYATGPPERGPCAPGASPGRSSRGSPGRSPGPAPQQLPKAQQLPKDRPRPSLPHLRRPRLRGEGRPLRDRPPPALGRAALHGAQPARAALQGPPQDEDLRRLGARGRQGQECGLRHRAVPRPHQVGTLWRRAGTTSQSAPSCWWHRLRSQPLPAQPPRDNCLERGLAHRQAVACLPAGRLLAGVAPRQVVGPKPHWRRSARMER